MKIGKLWSWDEDQTKSWPSGTPEGPGHSTPSIVEVWDRQLRGASNLQNAWFQHDQVSPREESSVAVRACLHLGDLFLRPGLRPPDVFRWCNTFHTTLLRKPAGRLGVVSPCERSENKEGVWGRGVVDTGAFFGRNRRCLGWRFWVSGSRLYH